MGFRSDFRVGRFYGVCHDPIACGGYTAARKTRVETGAIEAARNMTGMNMRKAVGVGLLAAAVLVLTATPLLAARERMFFEIVESDPGSRSQGWRGSVFDERGLAMQLMPGQTVKMPGGSVTGVACVMPWVPCGAILTVMLHGPNLDRAENVIMEGEWSYRLFVSAPGSKSEAVRGELLLDGEVVRPEPGVRATKTPMGVFIWTESPNPWGPHGWMPSGR
jgi:hypothetical protein